MAPKQTPSRKRKRKSSDDDEDYIEEPSSALNDDEEDVDTSSYNVDDNQEKLTKSTPKGSEKRAPKRVIVKEPKDVYSTHHFQNDNTNNYLPYIPGKWTPEAFYRVPQDVVMQTIRRNGSEGVSRAEIGYSIGLDATLKTGGRRVTTFITMCSSENTDHVGQFQKMDGKVRTLRFYWKESEAPEKFSILMNEFEALSGKKCPFKIGEVIKFPDQKLNTLRISDVTLKRLNRILKLTNSSRVVVTMSRIMKKITEEEISEGYKYSIDKKSLLKCLLALKTKRLVNFWETTVKSDSINHNVSLLAHRDIGSVEDAEVVKGIQDILDDFQREGRVFPHGQARSLKKQQPVEAKKDDFDDNLTTINEDINRDLLVKDRFDFFRLQTVRNSWKPNADEKENKVSQEASEEVSEEVSQEVNDDVSEDVNESVNEEINEDEEKVPMEEIQDETATTTPRGIASRGYQFYYGRDSIGYQNKAIRLHIAHEYAFYFVHGYSNSTLPHVFKLFPPNQPFSSWPVPENPHVFHNEESPKRFMPFQPKYKDIQSGWFMLQDFVASLPLSVLVLIVYIPRKISQEDLRVYLEDPVKRHYCVGYLEKNIREVLMKEKKIYKQLELIFCLLCTLGLAAIGKNLSPKRFPTAKSTMVFIAKSGTLFDTSTSEKGSACISPPISQYKKYTYDFNTLDDIYLYWHHMRAIVQSTPLSFKMDIPDYAQYSIRNRQYTIGMFDKANIEVSMDSTIESLKPFPPNDGVAGFDCALNMHLRRNWDLISAPSKLTGWFIQSFRKNADNSRSIIENRVQRLQKGWNSFIRNLLPSDMEMPKSKHEKMFSIDYPNLGDKSPMVKKVAVKTPRKIGKKRKPDMVDIVSNNARMNVRCRFSPKERDQLILIRAVGFFLNPVYRFWLDPSVLRDLMHEYVPESRNKTIQSLMACGVRELVRPNRLAYLQRVVRNLSTFPEMRRLRYELCSQKNAEISTKIEFFKEAFRTAMDLLFMDNNRTPHTSVSDEGFEQFLKDGNVSVTKETSVTNTLPYRCMKPESGDHIQHCIASNALLSVLIHSASNLLTDFILEQTPANIIQEVVQSMRSDGLIAKTRSNDLNDVSTKNMAALSFYFRHFFTHRYNPELIEEIGELFQAIDEGNRDEMLELEGDSPSIVVAASCTFSDPGYSIESSVDDDILDAFEHMDEDQITKKIRYLESANLHFEKVHVYIESNEEEKEDNFNLTSILSIMDKSRPVLDEIVSFERWLDQFDVTKRRQFRSIMDAVRGSKEAGLTLNEIGENVNLSNDQLRKYVEEMRDGQFIFEAGVDDIRWISVEFESLWVMMYNGRKYCPRPWIKPDGIICFSTIRWMAEAILMTASTKYGILMKDLKFAFEFAIQPIVIKELVILLEKAKCIEIVEKEFRSERRMNPFTPSSQFEKVTYIVPTSDGVERFSRIFHGVPLLSSMLPKT